MGVAGRCGRGVCPVGVAGGGGGLSLAMGAIFHSLGNICG